MPFYFLKNISFAQPFFLLFLLLAPLYWFFLWKKKEKKVVFFMPTTTGVKHLFSKKEKWIRYLSLCLLSLGFMSMVLAMAQPQIPLREEVIKRAGIDIVLAMDVSASMLSQDFKPNRLTVSKQLANAFIDKRQYDRIGLVTFSGEAITNCPLTTDHNTLKNILDNVTHGTLEDGTVIGVGLATAVARLKESKAKSKIVILLTDGDDDGNGFVSPIDAATLAKEIGVKVYTIGVGKYGSALSPASVDKLGEIIYEMKSVTINEGLLQQISLLSESGGRFYRATDAVAFSRIYEDIDTLEKTMIDTTIYKQQKIVALSFLLFTLICFSVVFLIKTLIYR
jgi:Ca-activated chloride channel homolog